jgi:hypothetical protein
MKANGQLDNCSRTMEFPSIIGICVVHIINVVYGIFQSPRTRGRGRSDLTCTYCNMARCHSRHPIIPICFNHHPIIQTPIIALPLLSLVFLHMQRRVLPTQCPPHPPLLITSLRARMSLIQWLNGASKSQPETEKQYDGQESH